jgi:hypothetical protein
LKKHLKIREIILLALVSMGSLNIKDLLKVGHLASGQLKGTNKGKKKGWGLQGLVRTKYPLR